MIHTPVNFAFVLNFPGLTVCRLFAHTQYNMQLTEQDIEEFKEKYAEHCGEELTNEQAAEYASRLLRMTEIIYTPMTNREVEDMQHEVERIRLSRYGVAE